jgi:intein/homing endonuclease
MIGVAVYLNRKKLTVAGTDDLCVLNAIVNAVGELGESTERVGKRRNADLWLSVGGLTRRPQGAEDEHLRWIRHKRLRVGDRITVQVVRTDRPNKPTASTPAANNRKAARGKLKRAIKSKSGRQSTERRTARR